MDVPRYRVVEAFCNKMLTDKKYHRHSEMDFSVNLKLTGIMNYLNILSESDLEFTSKSYSQNLKYLNEIESGKIQIYEELRKNDPKQPKKIVNQNEINLLNIKFPEFEIFFTIKLIVNGLQIDPESTTNIILISEFCEAISIRYKYKDLTPDSCLAINVYCVQLPKENSLIASTTIPLFDENFNLMQGKHVFVLHKKISANLNSKCETFGVIEDENYKELDKIVNSFNFPGSNKRNFQSPNSQSNSGRFINEYLVKIEKEKEFYSTDFYRVKYSEKVHSILSKIDLTFLECTFPTFNYPVIYEEEKSKIAKSFCRSTKYKNYLMDPELKWNNFLSKDNPITEKFSILSRLSVDAFAKSIKPTPQEASRIDELISLPDFIKLDDSDLILFWKFRYHLINKKGSLSKILNSVKWGDMKSEIEFLNNILRKWEKVEIGDILYMLSFRFCVNPKYTKSIYPKMNEVREFAVKQLKTLSNSELDFILLQLVQALRYEDYDNASENSLKIFLIEKCSQNINLATSLYCFLLVESDDEKTDANKNKPEFLAMILTFRLILKEFLESLNPEIKAQIDGQAKLREILIKNANDISKLKNDQKKKNLPIMLGKGGSNDMHKFPVPIQTPLDPNVRVTGVVAKECRVFLSAKTPIKYTFTVTNDSQSHIQGSDPSLFELMFKYGDDIRQDQLILQIISYMDLLLKKVNFDSEFTTYKVIATSKNDGFVEFVQNSQTIYDILKKHGQILPYLKEIGGVNTEQTIDSYINSCAGYCVVTYILGIGDRHLENLLINKTGRLFHIDFGFILGKDPKLYPPPMKLSKEMIECMGGNNNPKYEEFKTKCVNAFIYLRQHSRLIVNMFYLMIHSGLTEIIDYEKTLTKLNEKFCPDANDQKARSFILNKLEESVSSLFSTINEKFHDWANYFKR